MKKIYNVFYSLVSTSYSVIFLLFVYNMLFFSGGYYKRFTPDIIKMFIGAVLFIIICSLWNRLRALLSKKTATLFKFLVLMVLIVCQMLLLVYTTVPFGWDTGAIREVAIDGFDKMSVEYFASWPNNNFIAVVAYIWVKLTSYILPFVPALQRYVIINIIAVDLALIFGYLVAKRILDESQADSIAIGIIFLVTLAPWTAVVYTDAISTVFPILFIYSMLKASETDNKFMKNMWLFFAVFTISTGVCVKITNIIIVIALMIVILLKNDKIFNLNTIKNITVIILAVLSVHVLSDMATVHITDRVEEKVPYIVPYGVMYFLDTGIQTFGRGTYHYDVVLWHGSNKYNDDYTEQAFARITFKMKEYGVSGMIQHIYKKLMWTGSDGTFGYGIEWPLYLEEQSSKGTLKGILQNYIFLDSYFYQNILSQWLQGIWLLTCLGNALSIFYKTDSEKNKKLIFILKLTVCGLFLYLAIFENRARYIFLYIPIIIMVSQTGVLAVKQKFMSIIKK